MKQRITLLSDVIDQDSIDTKGLEFSESQVSIPSSLFYQRQDRLTLTDEDISPSLKGLLSNQDQLKLTYKSPDLIASSIFQNYHAPGFTLQLLPKSPNQLNQSIDNISKYFFQNFELPGFNHENYVLTATSLTYHLSPSLTPKLKQSALGKFINSFNSDIEISENIKDFEIVYDSSQDSKLKLQWISTPQSSDNTAIINSSPAIRKEIAILKPQNQDLEDLELSGLRTTLPSQRVQDEYVPPTKTLIYVKPRHHHSIENNTTISLSKPIGLHPTFKFNNISNSPNDEHCKLFISTILPSHLFFDKYQYNENQLDILGHWGESDLEAPIWKINQFGSLQLFQFKEHQDDLELVYHSRYLEPSKTPELSIVKPDLFYACDSSKLIEDYEHVGLNPFDDSILGVDSYFGANTVFYHLGQNDATTLDLQIPNLSWIDYIKTQIITLLVVLIGTAFLLYKIFNPKQQKSKKINIKDIKKKK